MELFVLVCKVPEEGEEEMCYPGCFYDETV
jgi:hypothetical protein